MSKMKLLFLLLILGGLTVFSSCDDNKEEEIPKKTGVLVVNEGNFGSANGSVSFYDEELMTITNNVVKDANSGDEVGATIQSMHIHDGIGYLVCNSSDKIEFISAKDLTYLANPITNISQPRYMTVAGDKGYISCWGPWDNWTLPNSYVAVMDLSSRTIVDSLECGSGPEGIIVVGNKLFVANSFETSVSVIDLNDNSSTKIDLLSSPQHFVIDRSGLLWISVFSGLYSVNSTSLEKTDSLEVANMAGKMAIDGTGDNIYLLTAQPWPSIDTDVFTFDTQVKQLSTSALFSGENFYGIGYNSTTDWLYVSDSKAFAGPGQIYVYSGAGMIRDEQITSVGPNSFYFK